MVLNYILDGCPCSLFNELFKKHLMQNKDKKNDNQKVLVAIIIIVYFCLYCLFLATQTTILWIDDESLANAFTVEKISTIREELQEKRGTVELLYSGSEFNHFKSVSCDERSDLVPRSTLKSCMLDLMPASVLENCYDLLPSSVYHKGCELFFTEVHVDFRHEASHCQALSQETTT